MKILFLVLAGIGFLLFLALLTIDAWNMYIAPSSGLPQIGFPFPMYRILFVMGWILGAVMSFFTKPKVKKFADKVKAKPRMIYVFGSNRLTEMLLNELLNLGMGMRTSLIAGRKRLWIENLPEGINKLILDNLEELETETLYNIIQFENAKRVIILVDDSNLAGNILTNVRKVNPEVEVLLLSNNKPAFLDLSAGKIENVQIIEDSEAILRELTGQLALGYERPDVISLPVPSAYVNRSPSLIEKDFKKGLKVLGTERNEKILKDVSKLQADDHILLYLQNTKVLADLLQLSNELKTPRKEAQPSKGEPSKKDEQEEKEEERAKKFSEKLSKVREKREPTNLGAQDQEIEGKEGEKETGKEEQEEESKGFEKVLEEKK